MTLGAYLVIFVILIRGIVEYDFDWILRKSGCPQAGFPWVAYASKIVPELVREGACRVTEPDITLS